MGRKRGKSVPVMRPISNKRAKHDVVAKGIDNSVSANGNVLVDKSITVESQNSSSPVEYMEIAGQKHFSSNSFTSVYFYAPSGFYLSQCCKKLNIKYSYDAVKFWSRIRIQRINPDSIPFTAFGTKEQTFIGFSCFSLFLTGAETDAALIREMVNRYFYNNFKSLGNFMGHNFSQYNHENPIVRDTLFSFGLTEVHLECLSRWFDCRIGVYDEKNWKRYGNWDDGNSDAATFLITMQDGKFMPIFDFN